MNYDLSDWLLPDGLEGEENIGTDNGILNWANYCLGLKFNGKLKQEHRLLTQTFFHDNTYDDLVKFSNNSHDNHVAILSLSVLFDIHIHKVSVRRYWEPRVFIFDKLVNHGGIWWIFYPVLLGIMIVSCLSNKKIRPAYWQKFYWKHKYWKKKSKTKQVNVTQRHYGFIKAEDIKTWDGPEGRYFTREFFKTDGKILALHRVECLKMLGHNMNRSLDIIDWCLTKSIGKNWRQDIWHIFYRDNPPIFEAWNGSGDE